jgi:hypothetical protein
VPVYHPKIIMDISFAKFWERSNKKERINSVIIVNEK